MKSMVGHRILRGLPDNKISEVFIENSSFMLTQGPLPEQSAAMHLYLNEPSENASCMRMHACTAKVVGHVNLTWVIWVAFTSSHMSQHCDNANKKSPDLFTHSHCCIITVFIVLINITIILHSYTWHEFSSQKHVSYLMCFFGTKFVPSIECSII